MRKKRVKTESQTRRFKRAFIAGLVVVIAFCLPWMAARFNWLQIDADAAVNVFCVAATAIGALLVVFELNNSDRVTCCSMLSDLNMKFIENERLTRLYQELCHCVQEPGRELPVDDSNPDSLHSSDLMAYMTFYEVINEYIKNGVLSIQQMDDLFGDRFFKLIHNTYVQEHELYSEPSSYANIFELYGMWRQYREHASSRNNQRFVVRLENAIPNMYIEEKLYLQETVQFYMNEDNILFSDNHGQKIHLSLRRLMPHHLEQVIRFQDKIIAGIEQPGIFAPSTKEEIVESMLVDYCYGLFDGNKLAAVCICVLNRKTKRKNRAERNLCVYTDSKDAYYDYLTFDTIQVAQEYRGFGIQSFFLCRAEDVARMVHANHIIATVAPDNPYSRNMFEKAGYDIYGGKEIEMYKSRRYLMVKKLAQEYSDG